MTTGRFYRVWTIPITLLVTCLLFPSHPVVILRNVNPKARPFSQQPAWHQRMSSRPGSYVPASSLPDFGAIELVAADRLQEQSRKSPPVYSFESTELECLNDIPLGLIQTALLLRPEEAFCLTGDEATLEMLSPSLASISRSLVEGTHEWQIPFSERLGEKLITTHNVVTCCFQQPTEAAYETGLEYVTGYAWDDNSPPGDSITGGGHGHLGDGTLNNPTSLAVSCQYFTNGDEKGYFKQGDLVYLPNAGGWYRVDDIGGMCSHPGKDQAKGTTRIDRWLAHASSDQESAVTGVQRFAVFHPGDIMPHLIDFDHNPSLNTGLTHILDPNASLTVSIDPLPASEPEIDE